MGVREQYEIERERLRHYAELTSPKEILFECIIYGDPRTKKNSPRVVHVGANGHKVLPSLAFKIYEQEALRQLSKAQAYDIHEPCNMQCVYYMKTRHKVDLGNLLAATCDILVNAEVIRDDNSAIIASHDGSRVLHDPASPRVEITITRINLQEE